MNIKEFVGVDSCYRTQNGIELTHEEFCNKVIEKMGGLDAVISYVPFDFETLKESYEEDRFFNSRKTPLREWNFAAGFCCENGKARMLNRQIINHNIIDLYRKHGITCFSPSDGVSILKAAARMWLAERQNEKHKQEKK